MPDAEKVLIGLWHEVNKLLGDAREKRTDWRRLAREALEYPYTEWVGERVAWALYYHGKVAALGEVLDIIERTLKELREERSG